MTSNLPFLDSGRRAMNVFVNDEVAMRPVLLVSDDEWEIEAIRDLLTHMGFDVCVADSPAEAGLFCKARRPCVVVVDIEMVGGNGFESIAIVRRIVRDCRVIAATRGDHKDLWPKVSFARGANTYIVGPLTAAKLADSFSAASEPPTCH